MYMYISKSPLNYIQWKYLFGEYAACTGISSLSAHPWYNIRPLSWITLKLMDTKLSFFHCFPFSAASSLYFQRNAYVRRSDWLVVWNNWTETVESKVNIMFKIQRADWDKEKKNKNIDLYSKLQRPGTNVPCHPVFGIMKEIFFNLSLRPDKE